MRHCELLQDVSSPLNLEHVVLRENRPGQFVSFGTLSESDETTRILVHLEHDKETGQGKIPVELSADIRYGSEHFFIFDNLLGEFVQDFDLLV